MNYELSPLVDASEKVCQQLKILLDSEQEKRQALLQRDSEKIYSFVQSQQAIVMKLDSLERKRNAIQEELGFNNKTSTQILESVDEKSKQIAAPVFEELKSLANQLQSLNQTSLEIANNELRLIEMTSPRPGDDKHGIYTAGGKTGGYNNNSSSFREKI